MYMTLNTILLFSQDIIECEGPQSRLTELNGDVKKIFRNLRLRIQVRTHMEFLCITSNMDCVKIISFVFS